MFILGFQDMFLSCDFHKHLRSYNTLDAKELQTRATIKGVGSTSLGHVLPNMNLKNELVILSNGNKLVIFLKKSKLSAK